MNTENPTHNSNQPENSSHSPEQHQAASASPAASNEVFKFPKINFKDFNFGDAFKKFLGILKLDKKVIEETAMDEKTNAAALIFTLVATILPVAAFGIFGLNMYGVSYRPSVVDVIAMLLFGLVGVVIAFYAITFVATNLFKGQGTLAQIFRVMGLSYGIAVLNTLGYIFSPLVTLVALVSGVWMLVVYFVTVKTVFKLDTKNTVFTIIIVGVVNIILSSLFTASGLNPATKITPSFDMNTSYEDQLEKELSEWPA